MPNDFFNSRIDGQLWNRPGDIGEIRQGGEAFGLRYDGDIGYDEYMVPQAEESKTAKPIRRWERQAAQPIASTRSFDGDYI